LFIKDVNLIPKNEKTDQQLVVSKAETGKKIFIISSERKKTEDRYAGLTVAGKKLNIPVLTCDATALKTAARNNITLYLMEGAIVKNKWGGTDIEKALK
jgi:hypothetical protein